MRTTFPGTRNIHTIAHGLLILMRAAWLGARIVMRRVSPESISIFDFILELSRVCSGHWKTLAESCDLASDVVDKLLDYAATFLVECWQLLRT